MNEYNPPSVSIVILDFNREKECSILLDSIEKFAKFRHEIVYVSNGGNHSYILDHFNNGRIDKLVLNKDNNGCGLGTRQGFQSSMCSYILYVQVDQFLFRTLEQDLIDKIILALEKRSDILYCDLAGNQGHGNFSERALLINRKKYLSIPGLEETIGGPGPWANYRWTENLVQEYVGSNNLKFFTGPNFHFFADNGKWSYRSYPCGGETIHSTDEKVLRIIKPLKARYNDFPNLKLTDSEWEEVLSGKWPEEGKIPEADKHHSFKVWN